MNECRLSPGDIVLVPFPFTNYLEKKRRPALVVSSREFNRSTSNVILIAISSNISAGRKNEIIILGTHKAFSQTGLRRSSAIKCGTIFTFSQRYIERRLGRVAADILQDALRILANILECEPSGVG